MITYSQADIERFPCPQAFSQVIVDAFKKCNVLFERWVCSKEKHLNTGGFHYHMAIQLPQSRWKAIKNQIQKDSNITVYFSAKHAGYKFAYRYVTKCAPDCDIVESENHGFMGMIREDDQVLKYMMANAKIGRDRENKRKESKDNNDIPSTSKTAKKSKDLRHKDVTKLII